jgi:hypothetical protein
MYAFVALDGALGWSDDRGVRNYYLSFALAVIIAPVVAAPAAHARVTSSCDSASGTQNLVADCGFEDPVVGSGSFKAFDSGTALGAWTVNSNGDGVDVVDKTGGGYGSYPVHSGNQSVDLNKSLPTGVHQALQTLPGQNYQLTFSLSGYPGSPGCPGTDPKTLTVTAGSTTNSYSFTPNPAISPQGNQPFEAEATSFTATSASTTLTFTPSNTGCTGPVIDDVSVVPSLGGSPTPPVAPNPVLTGPKKQPVSPHLVIVISCGIDACLGQVDGVIKVFPAGHPNGRVSVRAGRARSFDLKAKSVEVAANESKTVKLKVPKAAQKALKDALDEGGRASAKLTASLRSSTDGPAADVKRKVRLVR